MAARKLADQRMVAWGSIATALSSHNNVGSIRKCFHLVTSARSQKQQQRLLHIHPRIRKRLPSSCIESIVKHIGYTMTGNTRHLSSQTPFRSNRWTKRAYNARLSGIATLAASLACATIFVFDGPSSRPSLCDIEMLEKRWAGEIEVLTSPVDAELPVSNTLLERCKVKDSPVDFYVSSSYMANHPIEDRHSALLTNEGNAFLAVFDGHGGWQVAEFAEKWLVHYANAELGSTKRIKGDELVEKASSALKHAFLKTEEEVVKNIRPAFHLGFGDLSRVGACALVTLCLKDTVLVANAGDVRAVIGRQQKQKEYKAIPLSSDHNARILSEQIKLAQLHPDEDDIIRCKTPEACYVKGRLQPTRSLGDLYLKYVEFNGPPYDKGDRSRGRHIPPPYSPPYVLADPEITVHQIDPSDRFLVIASDGLWDFMANDEVVEVVRHQMELGTPNNAAIKLIECALTRSAKKYGITMEEVLNTPPGKTRRRRHDDTTVIVMFFKSKK